MPSVALPKGAKPRPALEEQPPLQVVHLRRLRCPYCDSTHVRHNGRKGRIRYYKCRSCADPETGDWTPFQVLVIEVES